MLVNEVFQTLQGEATWTGTPSVFVRFQGCDVGCPWCDTKYTWDFEATADETADVFTRNGEAGGVEYPPAVLLHEIRQRFTARHLVITGGEPIGKPGVDLFIKLAVETGWTVQIETSGTRALDKIHKDAWVTVSPKVNMPGGYEVLESAMQRANELKFPVGRPSDIELVRFFARDDVTIWLQPLSESKRATELCIAAATENNWRVSLQTHKSANLR